MSAIVLPLHNILRWAVLGVAITVVFRSYRGWLKKGMWGERDRKLSLSFTILLDIQLTFGVLLFIGRNLNEWGRFIMDHVSPMIIAVVLAHVGKVLSGKASESTEKYRRAALWYSLALTIILVSIPWSRPLWFSF